MNKNIDELTERRVVDSKRYVKQMKNNMVKIKSGFMFLWVPPHLAWRLSCLAPPVAQNMFCNRPDIDANVYGSTR